MLGSGPVACDRSSAKAALPAPAEELRQAIHLDADGAPLPRADVVVAGGCFWCVEAALEQVVGVHNVVSGYAGGMASTANYGQVSAGSTKHAEAVRVTFDPSVISYAELLQVFMTAHDPTQLNRQGNDVGPQYRSAIFFANPEEQRVAQAYIDQVNSAGVFDKPVATTLEPLDAFYLAEDYHQDYAVRNPGQPYIRFVSQPKAEKVRTAFPERIKGAEPASAAPASEESGPPATQPTE